MIDFDELYDLQEREKQKRLEGAEEMLLSIPLQQAQRCAKILTIVCDNYDFDSDYVDNYIIDAKLIRMLNSVPREAEVKVIASKGKAKQSVSIPASQLLSYVLFASPLGGELDDACDPAIETDDEGNETIIAQRSLDDLLNTFWDEFEIDKYIQQAQALKSEKNSWIPRTGMIAQALDEELAKAGDCFKNQTQRRSFVFQLMETALGEKFKHRIITEASLTSTEYETLDSVLARCISQAIAAFNKAKNRVCWLQDFEKELKDENGICATMAGLYFPRLFNNT